MKRVDFDPNGERNPQNRGKSGYVRISWDEAIKIVTDEIKRQKREYGPGAITFSHGSHHTWAMSAITFSALFRFANAVGMTRIHHNPDFLEGWFLGAVHHWGHTLHVGQSETYGTVEDCLQNCDMIVSSAADPESTSGSYGAQEGSTRRRWLKDPKRASRSFTSILLQRHCAVPARQWFAPKPTTSVRDGDGDGLRLDQEDLYDKRYVSDAVHRFDGIEDVSTSPGQRRCQNAGVAGTGTALTKDVRALAREWGREHLSARGGSGDGHGSACRNSLAFASARVMVCLVAMQSLGRPGVDMGDLRSGATDRFTFLLSPLCRRRHSRRIFETSMPVELPAHAATARP